MENFNKQKFLYLCKARFIGKKLICFKTVNSTNDYASRLEDKALKLNKPGDFFEKFNGTVIISETQSGGHGRNYKKWYSPSGGLWFTLILLSKIKAADVEKVNLIMAVSIYEAIKFEFAINTRIKWPNDIYYKDRKICGILSQLNTHYGASFLNIGVGLNVNLSFKEISSGDTQVISNASSIKEIIKNDADREKLLAGILENFEINYEKYLETQDMRNIFSKIGNSISI